MREPPSRLLRSHPPREGEGCAKPATVQTVAPSLPLRGEGPNAVRGRGVYRLGPTSTVTRARELRKTMTHQEVRLWLRLRELKAQGLRFRRQVPIERWIADFACFASRVIIEVDGMQHGFDAQARRDAARDGALADAGFLTLRFTNDEIWSNIDGVVETVFIKSQARLSPLPVTVPSTEPAPSRYHP